MRRWASIAVLAFLSTGARAQDTLTVPLRPQRRTRPEDAGPPARETRGVAPGLHRPLRPLHLGSRYNDVAQKSSHNSYGRSESLFDQLVFHRIRSLELDIHVDKGSTYEPDDHDWFVYHHTNGDAETSCHRLSDCLGQLRAFHDAFPEHEAVTVFIDVKDDWRDAHHQRPANLDQRIREHIPAGALFVPGALLAGCGGATTLRDAVTRQGCDWPRLATLRGKLLFVLTGPNDKLHAYVADGAQAVQRAGGSDTVAFVALGVSGSSALDAIRDNRGYVVFYNTAHETGWRAIAAAVRDAGFVSRVYDGSEGAWESEFSEAVGVAHHIAMNDINYRHDPWARTHSTRGYPFRCLAATDCNAEANGWTERGAIITTTVRSGDIEDESDSFHFHIQMPGTASAHTWTASVASASSWIEDFAKACLMARASSYADAPYFAVCRPAENEPLRVQYRLTRGADTRVVEADIAPTAPRVGGGTVQAMWEETMTHVKLVIDAGGRCAHGYGSYDGQRWSLIRETCDFPATQPLTRQGLAVSSHGSSAVSFVWGNVALDGARQSASSFGWHYRIPSDGGQSDPAIGAGINDGFSSW